MAAIALVAVAAYAAQAAGIAGTLAATALTTVAGIAGSLIDRAIFSGGKGQTFEGPRLQDNGLTQANPGAPLPLAFGTVRITGQVIADFGLETTRHEKRTKGGKGFGGGGSSTTVHYTHARSFMVGFCETPRAVGAVEIRRMWAQGKLIYDQGAQQHAAEVRVYLGTDSDAPDSFIQSRIGVDRTTGFPRVVKAFFQSLQLADFGNNPMPTIEAEIVMREDETLATVLDCLIRRAGVTRYDVTPCAHIPVLGYKVGQVIDARAAIEAIIPVYNVIGCARRDGLRFMPRGTFAPLAIPAEMLGVAADEYPTEEPVRLELPDAIEPPRTLALNFFDPARDYQINSVVAERLTGLQSGNPVVDVPVVMTEDEAQKVAERYIYDATTGGNRFRQLSLPPSYQFLDVGDLVDVEMLGRFERVRIREVVIGANGIVLVDGRLEDSAHLISEATGINGTIPEQEIGEVPDTIMVRLDIPILTELHDDAGFIIACSTAQPTLWRGCTVFRSIDGTAFDELVTIGDPAIIGDCDTTLGAGGRFRLDRGNTLDVTLVSPDFELNSISDVDLLGYHNFAAVGSEADGWEILQFRDAELLAPGQYRLSNFLRGRRGTDWKIGGHVAGEKFVLLENGVGLERISDPSSLIGVTRTYKPVSVHQSLAAVTGTTFANTAIGLKPFSPCHIKGRRETNDDVTVTWINRSRIPNDWPDFEDVPLGEESERYRVQVYDGVDVVRSEIVFERQFVYSAADQATDFGSAQATYTLTVEQLAGSGRIGYSTEAVVPNSVAGEPSVAFATWDPLDQAPNHVLSNGNLTIAANSSSQGYTTGAGTQRTQGKYYWEGRVDAHPAGAGVGQAFGLVNGLAANNTFPASGSGWDIKAAGDKNLYEEALDYGDISGNTQWAPGDNIEHAWDADLDKYWVRRAGGDWNNTPGDDPVTNVGGRSTTAGGNPLMVGWDSTTSGEQLTANFGASTFAHAVPTGFKPGFRLDEVGRTWSMWSPTDKSASCTVSEGTVVAGQGGQRAQVTTGAFHGARSDMGRTFGKLYAEIIVNSQGANFGIGVADAAAVLTVQLGSGATSIAYRPNGNVVRNGAVQGTISSYVNGDVICVAIDFSINAVWFRKAGGDWNNNPAANPVSGAGGWDISPLAATRYLAMVSDTSGHAATINCGSAEFRHAIPSGFTGIYT